MACAYLPRAYKPRKSVLPIFPEHVDPTAIGLSRTLAMQGINRAWYIHPQVVIS